MMEFLPWHGFGPCPVPCFDAHVAKCVVQTAGRENDLFGKTCTKARGNANSPFGSPKATNAYLMKAERICKVQCHRRHGARRGS